MDLFMARMELERVLKFNAKKQKYFVNYTQKHKPQKWKS